LETARLRDRIAGTALLTVALVWFVLVFQTIEPSQGTEAGPRAFPLFFGVVLAVLSLLLLLQSLRPQPPDRQRDSVTVAPGELSAVAMTVGGFVAYGLLLEPFGFIPTTAFMVIVLMVFVLRIRSLLLIASMALGLSLGSYLVFGKLLGTYLAPGQIITIYF
jgi:putative tricarboxylic transport membrane protein